MVERGKLICRVRAGVGDYQVLAGAIDRLIPQVWDSRWSQAVIIGDANTVGLFGGRVTEALHRIGVPYMALPFSPGEPHKSRATKEMLEDLMLANGCDRCCCVVGLGGGVSLDLAGYVAATYMRGVDHINLPTSLLAQVDAAIGGKTGVNTPRGKNLVGAFHHPRAVIVDTAVLASLPAVEQRNGLAEVIKHAVIADDRLFTRLESWAEGQADAALPEQIVHAAIRIKAAIVGEDQRDRRRRMLLNYGHTAGHAMEVANDFVTPHGQAVAAGMLVEARLAGRISGFPTSDVERLERLLERVRLPTAPLCQFEFAAPHLALDKKYTCDTKSVSCALPQRIGVAARNGEHWHWPVDVEAFSVAWGKTSGGAQPCYA